MSILSKDKTTLGALIGGMVGLIAAVGMVVLSKAVWVMALGNPAPIFPYENPALFSMPLAFVTIWLLSPAAAARPPDSPPAKSPLTPWRESSSHHGISSTHVGKSPRVRAGGRWYKPAVLGRPSRTGELPGEGEEAPPCLALPPRRKSGGDSSTKPGAFIATV